MITRLRQAGYSYKEIADALKISINTVKSFCRRNGLTGTSENKKHICINEVYPKNWTQILNFYIMDTNL